MNIEGKSVQEAFAAALAWLSAALGVLIVPIIMLTAAMIKATLSTIDENTLVEV